MRRLVNNIFKRSSFIIKKWMETAKFYQISYIFATSMARYRYMRHLELGYLATLFKKKIKMDRQTYSRMAE